MRESIEIARALFAGAPAHYDGAFASLHGAVLDYGRPDIEIWLAGRGPKMLALGGAVADGVMLDFIHKDSLADSVATIRSGGPARICYSTAIVTDHDDLEFVRPHMTYRLVDSPDPVKEAIGLGVDDVERIRSAMGGGLHAAAAHVRDEWIEPFIITGSIDACAAEIRSLHGDPHDGGVPPADVRHARTDPLSRSRRAGAQLGLSGPDAMADPVWRRRVLSRPMDELHGKVGVVTGAGSGIGRAVALAFAHDGMKVVLADIQADALDDAVAEVTATGAEAIGVVTDVSDAAAIEALAAATIDAYGAVHVVHNNAGVVTAGPLETLTDDDWNWVLGVDLWSVIYGIRTFLPLIREAGEGHIVNTASTAGLQANPNIGPYNVAKFGVVALTETLALELGPEAAINASVLCPGAINTRIVESERNRPDTLADHVDTEADPGLKTRSARCWPRAWTPPRSPRWWSTASAPTASGSSPQPWKQIMIDRARPWPVTVRWSPVSGAEQPRRRHT